MIDYKTLKHSENGMPTWEGFLGPVLLVASKGDLWSRKDLTNAVLEEVPLPKELAELRYTSKWHDLVAPDRVGWTYSDLKYAGLLNSPKRGYYQITDLGQKILNENKITDITGKLIHSQSGYIEHLHNLQNSQDKEEITPEETFELGPKQIEAWFKKQEQDLREKLLDILYNTDPYKFEDMMVKLLSRMGYKGPNGDAFVTQKSNDGGIDGILNQDPLGLRRIYVQVKRYGESNTVSRQTISQFHGDLDLQGANTGVFITTSSFTSGAEEAARKFNIKLIDGDTLTKLMIDYKVGVQVKQNYELLEIDNDFFEND